MFPLGFVIGAVAGATAALMFGSEIAMRARPIAKVALKAALTAMHEARVYGAEVTEAAEDLYAEAKSEVAAEVMTATAAAGKAQTAQAAGAEPATSSRPAGVDTSAVRRPAVRTAKRSSAMSSDHV